jgi:hypothetical protein
MRLRTLAVLFAAGLVAVGVAVAGVNQNWSDHADGAQEVPPRETQGQAQAIFHLSPDGTQLEYKLIASNIENVFQAHIHRQVPGQNGPIVVWLYPSTAPVPGPLGAGRTDGVLATGTITAANVIPPPGMPDYGLDDVVNDMNTGNAYVNLHTNDGVAPTNTGAGDFPGGEVRADIRE